MCFFTFIAVGMLFL